MQKQDLLNIACQDFKNRTAEALGLAPNAPQAKSDRVKGKDGIERYNPYKRHATIKMPYIGSVITENHCYGRNGKHSYMKAEAVEWQNDLIALVQNCGVKDWQLPLKVRVEAVFKNQRESCDVHNFKCLFDGIQKATGLNDRNYHVETVPGVIDKKVEPHILITISEI